DALCTLLLRRAHPSVLLFLSTVAAPSALSTLSLHDALPICSGWLLIVNSASPKPPDTLIVCVFLLASGSAISTTLVRSIPSRTEDRKSTRLNSSHVSISYAVFCLKKQPEPRFGYSLVVAQDQ